MKMKWVFGLAVGFVLLLLISILAEQSRYEFRTVTFTMEYGVGRSAQVVCNYKFDKRTGKSTLMSGDSMCPR